MSTRYIFAVPVYAVTTYIQGCYIVERSRNIGAPKHSEITYQTDTIKFYIATTSQAATLSNYKIENALVT